LGRRIAARGYHIELFARASLDGIPIPNARRVSAARVALAIGIRNIRPGGHFGMLFTHGLPWAIAAACVAPSMGIAAMYLGAYFVSRFAMAWTVGYGVYAIRFCAVASGCCGARSAFVFCMARKFRHKSDPVGAELRSLWKRAAWFPVALALGAADGFTILPESDKQRTYVPERGLPAQITGGLSARALCDGEGTLFFT